MKNDSSRISPTAHYTSFVWYRAGLSHPSLITPLGRTLHAALRPMNLLYERFSDRPDLDMMLLARHRVLDHLLEREIAGGGVRQVLEIAAGLSPRGYTFARRHQAAGLRYVEADLPEMAAAKRERLERAGLLGDNHRVVELDALAEIGPSSLEAVARAHLDPERPTAFVTEGLLGYFDRLEVEGMWRRFAAELGRFPRGVYLSDLNLSGDVGGMRTALVFRRLLGLFARGRVHLHYADAASAERALLAAGFARARLLRPDDVPDAEVPGRERRHVVRLLRAEAG